jgi:hypothetical protein
MAQFTVTLGCGTPLESVTRTYMGEKPKARLADQLSVSGHDRNVLRGRRLGTEKPGEHRRQNHNSEFVQDYLLVRCMNTVGLGWTR